MKFEHIFAEAKFKVSANYWNSLSDIEQQFIIDRHSRDGLQALKLIISSARKQVPGFDKIYGNGFIEKDGKKYQFSGSDTRKFKQIN